MADELIDIFDENMNLLGTALKSQAHREGLWHKTFHCWLARKNDEGRVMGGCSCAIRTSPFIPTCWTFPPPAMSNPAKR